MANLMSAYTFFATHYQQLTNLATLYPNVENYHFEVQRFVSVEGNCEKVIYSHILSKGKTEEKHYGLKLAEVSTMRKCVVDEAKRLAKVMEQKAQENEKVSPETLKERAIFKLAARLTQTARNSQLDEESLRGYLKSLKEQYLKEIALAET